VPKTKTHPILEKSFQRVNEAFFNGMMEQPNLRIGKGVNRLGTYEYATDTVMVSQILIDNEELMDYVMYHELLHKKHQYTAKKGRQRHHSKKFKEDEAKFPNAELLEQELNKLVRRKKRGFSLFW
jgi:predicted metal-dependent hydrolase